MTRLRPRSAGSAGSRRRVWPTPCDACRSGRPRRSESGQAARQDSQCRSLQSPLSADSGSRLRAKSHGRSLAVQSRQQSAHRHGGAPRRVPHRGRHPLPGDDICRRVSARAPDPSQGCSCGTERPLHSVSLCSSATVEAKACRLDPGPERSNVPRHSGRSASGLGRCGRSVPLAPSAEDLRPERGPEPRRDRRPHWVLNGVPVRARRSWPSRWQPSEGQCDASGRSRKQTDCLGRGVAGGVAPGTVTTGLPTACPRGSHCEAGPKPDVDRRVRGDSGPESHREFVGGQRQRHVFPTGHAGRSVTGARGRGARMACGGRCGLRRESTTEEGRRRRKR